MNPKISRGLYTASRVLHIAGRIAGDLSAIASGNPHRMATRAKNRVLGAALHRITRPLFRKRL